MKVVYKINHTSVCPFPTPLQAPYSTGAGSDLSAADSGFSKAGSGLLGPGSGPGAGLGVGLRLNQAVLVPFKASLWLAKVLIGSQML